MTVAPEETPAGTIEVIRLQPAGTRELRRRVLYGHVPGETAVYPRDGQPGSFHLGARADGALVAVASWYPEATDLRPSRAPYRLRGMAVDPTHQGRGVGRLVFQAGVAALKARNADLLWANARDDALGFYGRLGMTVTGDGFLTAGGLSHHVVVLDLPAAARPA